MGTRHEAIEQKAARSEQRAGGGRGRSAALTVTRSVRAGTRSTTPEESGTDVVVVVLVSVTCRSSDFGPPLVW